MVEDSYPLANEENKILQIRLGLDAPAARYCREWENLQSLLEEIGHYDEQLDLEKMTNNNNQGQQRGYSRQYDTARQASGNPCQYPNRQTAPYRTANNTGNSTSSGSGASRPAAGSADKGKGADNGRERYRQGDRNRES
jgi:hypothetical protein